MKKPNPPRELQRGPGSARAGQEVAGEGFSQVRDFRQTFALKEVLAAPGLNSPVAWEAAQSTSLPSQPHHTGPWPSLWVEDDSGPRGGRGWL